MTILEETAAHIKQNLGEDCAGITIERVVIGLFFSGVKLSNGAGGVCFTPIKDIPQAVCCPSSAGRIFDPFKLKGMKVKDVLKEIPSKEPIKTAIGIATLNALSATCWERGLRGSYTIQMNMDAQEAVRMPKENSVAVIGAFVPILRTLKQRGGTWWVIEQDPKTLKEDELHYYVPEAQSKDIIRKADVLIITGVTLVNQTFEGIINSVGSGTEIAVIGPTASFLPEALFQRGVRVVGGVWVKKPDDLLNVLAAGASGYHFFDKIAPRIVIEKKRQNE
jgi:uncharacterized protein (DUF4213/DUF364 family)